MWRNLLAGRFRVVGLTAQDQPVDGYDMDNINLVSGMGPNVSGNSLGHDFVPLRSKVCLINV